MKKKRGKQQKLSLIIIFLQFIHHKTKHRLSDLLALRLKFRRFQCLFCYASDKVCELCYRKGKFRLHLYLECGTKYANVWTAIRDRKKKFVIIKMLEQKIT